MARFKIWRKSSHTVEVLPSSSEQLTSGPPQFESSTTPPGSPEADPTASSAPVINNDYFQEEPSSRQASFDLDSTPQRDSSPATATAAHRWTKVPAGYANGPWGESRQTFRAYKPPEVLTLLDTSAHNPRSPLAWFIDQLGIPIAKIVPRAGNCIVAHHCEYELGNLNISRSIPLPSGYCEPFISNRDFADGSWRDVLIFSSPVARNPLRMVRACEVVSPKTERITIAFTVNFLDTGEDDKYTRMSYEESWMYLALEIPTLGGFYDDYGRVLKRTIEEHRAAREYYMGPWKAEGRGKDTKVPKMYEESRKFLKVDGDAERKWSKDI